MRSVLRDYGMVLVLLVLCIVFSLATSELQPLEGTLAAEDMVEAIVGATAPTDVVVVISSEEGSSMATSELIATKLAAASYVDVVAVSGEPRDARVVLDELRSAGRIPGAISVTGKAMKWRLWEIFPEAYPEFSGAHIVSPGLSLRSNFLKPSNLLAIVDRIVVIAIIAIGMTMVIITAGIDLSVGSLIALSAVIGTLIMKKLGGLDAGPGAVALGFFFGALACGVSGGFVGVLVAWCRVAPFIATLAIMMVARGLAFKITGGFSIYQVPKGLPWLGQGYSLGMPNTVILLVVLYGVAHVFMSRMKLGRYIYAVGGNEEAARLSGVPVRRVTIFVYFVCGLMAGIGGCIQASQLSAGAPNSGLMYELYVIAAVVVGGTSLAGGSGRILGTLIGAFIISVIQNGMNLVGWQSYTQEIVLGSIILAAVLLDKLRGSSPFASLKGR